MMSPRLRAVFDTNVLVSAMLLKNSTPGRAFRHAVLTGDLVFTSETWNELWATISRAKFDRYLSLSQRNIFMDSLRPDSMVHVTRRIQACRDRRDDKFLEAAIAGDCEFLVTGDLDLLALDPFDGIRIVRPGDYLQRSGFVL